MKMRVLQVRKKKTGWVGYCLTVLLFLLLWMPCASGEYLDGLAVTYLPWPENGTTPVVRVNLYRRGSRQYLFLPGWWDTSRLYIYAPQDSGEDTNIQGADVEPVSLLGNVPTAQLTPDLSVTIRNSKKKSLKSFIVKQGGNLPSLFIQTETNSARSIHRSRNTREPGDMVMFDSNGRVIYNGGLREIKTRGNTTFNYPKKPYQIKLEDQKDLLGNGAARTWVLLADYLDSSLLHNRITLDMARYAGMRYAISSQSVDLYINGNYMGVYLLCEKPQIGSNRVAVRDMQAEMEFLNPLPLETYKTFSETFQDKSSLRGYLLEQEPEDITGGYLLEVDKAFRIRNSDGSYVFTASGIGITIKEPEIVGKEQIYYLWELLNTFDRAIRGKDGIDPLSGQHYREFMDEESLAIKFLLEDISMNFDAKAGSQYFYKDSSQVDSKLYAGPGWDYDLTYGILDINPRTGFLTERGGTPSWYTIAYRNQPSFRTSVAQMYYERMRPAMEILMGNISPEPGSPLRSLQEYHEEIGSSGEMNEILWPSQDLKKYSSKLRQPFKNGPSNLQRFLRLRMEWMDKIFPLPMVDEE